MDFGSTAPSTGNVCFGDLFSSQEQAANVETAGRMTHQRDSVAAHEFPARETRGEIVSQPCRSGADRSRGEIVEVVEGYASATAGARLLPKLKLRSNASIIFKLAQRIEPGETRNEHDVHATTSRGFPRHGPPPAGV
jgi:hypothetical protein